MIGQKAIARALPGFNDLGRSVTPIFFGWIIIFLYQFHCVPKKIIEIIYATDPPLQNMTKIICNK